ncbi:hypothetical protein SLEP1_g39715 [Rubroshorea leprosula]|uniref:Uncharacterized protein n=2 Tax=Rubroshorea leprosula TaxID=152421 RepID=A0AAV5L146_9ROSI|nr:hypothetical protein SLEP1_g39715 [Rubroshorea leprosula]
MVGNGHKTLSRAIKMILPPNNIQTSSFLRVSGAGLSIAVHVNNQWHIVRISAGFFENFNARTTTGRTVGVDIFQFYDLLAPHMKCNSCFTIIVDNEGSTSDRIWVWYQDGRMYTTQSIETVGIPNGADQGINVLELEATDHRYINFSRRVLRRFFNKCYHEVMHVQPQLRAGPSDELRLRVTHQEIRAEAPGLVQTYSSLAGHYNMHETARDVDVVGDDEEIIVQFPQATGWFIRPARRAESIRVHLGSVRPLEFRFANCSVYFI